MVQFSAIGNTALNIMSSILRYIRKFQFSGFFIYFTLKITIVWLLLKTKKYIGLKSNTCNSINILHYANRNQHFMMQLSSLLITETVSTKNVRNAVKCIHSVNHVWIVIPNVSIVLCFVFIKYVMLIFSRGAVQSLQYFINLRLSRIILSCLLIFSNVMQFFFIFRFVETNCIFLWIICNMWTIECLKTANATRLLPAFHKLSLFGHMPGFHQ